jgi:hypothetical protein
MKTNYQSFKERIEKAALSELPKLEERLSLLWENGIFTVLEFQRLDALICDKQINEHLKK